jgi:hypothetical protein
LLDDDQRDKTCAFRWVRATRGRRTWKSKTCGC